MTLGDLLLALSLFLFLASTASLFRYREEYEIHLRRMIRAIPLLLGASFLLLAYSFVTSDFSIHYVWAFSSRHHPLLYKLSGVLAGQEGTLLFWAFLISIGGLWLVEKEGFDSPFPRKAQTLVLLLGAFFLFLTLSDSPFATIYEVYPELPPDFLPPDGAGLNPLLLDPWMAVHPALVFIGYASLTVPFAVAIAYLFESLRGETRGLHRMWVRSASYWGRIAWLFLTLGISVGGVWAYKVLGWGGFWAWDPVETASYIPWVMLTGALHALAEHRREREKYTILTPVLFAFSFSLVVYATLVTRSGFFESVHAFSAGKPGFYFVLLAAAAILSALALAAVKYLRTEEETPPKDEALITRTNLFYLTILLFILLTIIPFWGITFPALTKLLSGRKVATGVSFFNLWSYPFLLLLLLLMGLCIGYRTKRKEKALQEFGVFAGLTLLAALFRPTEAWKITDYTAIVTPVKPLLYTTLGSASVLAFLPPSVYLFYNVTDRLRERLRTLRRRDRRMRAVGLSLIHFGVVLIAVGAVYSTAFTVDVSTSLDSQSRDFVHIPGTIYGVRLIDYREYSDYPEEAAPSSQPPGWSILQFYEEIASGVPHEQYTVYGEVAERIDSEHSTYLRLVGGGKELWVAIQRAEVPTGIRVVTTGSLMVDFPSPPLNRTFPLILFSPGVERVEGPEKEPLSTTQEVRLVIYEKDKRISEGTARSISYRGKTTVQKVMIDRGPLRDIYVIFSGLSGREIPIDIKVKPLINWLWIGVLLFISGILLLLASETGGARR
jgi:cytochrome c-type biogenesis protein CcmF